MALDEADKRILRILQSDTRISNQELAEKTGLSPSVCWRKVKSLQDTGVVTGYRVTVDEEKAGLNFSAIVHVTLATHEASSTSALIERISERPEVLTCFVTTGEADYHLRVVCKDKEAYNIFLDEFLLRLPGIGHVRTHVVLKTIKLQSQLPV